MRFVDDARNHVRIYTSGYGQMVSSFNVIHCISSIKVSRINPKSAMTVFVKRARWILWRERKATGLV